MRAPFAVAAVLAAMLLRCGLAAAMDLPELNDRTKPAVVTITVYDRSRHKLGTGTGFFVSSDGRLVTNVHVIEHASRATATLENGKTVDIAGVIAQDPDADIAVLKAIGDGYPALVLGDTKTLVQGQEIVVVGAPMGLSGSISTGIVAAIREHGAAVEEERRGLAGVGAWQIQITAPISPGSSGSPVLTRDGRVVAVAVGINTAGENLNFAVRIENARALLDHAGDHASPQPFGGAVPASELIRNLGISAAVFLVCGVAYAALRRGTFHG
jgi:S1-C subfamily serine protease